VAFVSGREAPGRKPISPVRKAGRGRETNEQNEKRCPVTSRLRERYSSLAVWSSRFALVAIPILVIAAIGHRIEKIDAAATYGIMALGFSLAALAVVAALAAFEAIWRDGRKGFGSAMAGFILGLAVLTVPAVGAWKIVQYPPIFDVSTDLENPPRFLSSGRSDGNPYVGRFSSDEIALLREAYPDIVPRYYPLDTVVVFDAADAIVERRRWTVLDRQPPQDAGSSGRMEAVAETLVFGFKQDVAIRIAPEGEGTLVDMRSAARSGTHDFGADAERIREFFVSLDTALQGLGAAPE
jgi:Protein of unknown function (DUF1499)